MQTVVNKLRGSVRVEVEGIFPERFLNLCATQGVEFWDLERVSDNSLRATMNTAAYRRVDQIAESAQCRVRTVRREGAPFFLRRFKKRYFLLAGMLVCIGLILLSSMYIWEIKVTGNSTISEGEILAALDEVGMGIGTWGLSVESSAIRNEMLNKVDRLLWIAVNVKGSRAEVIVRERTDPPEIIDPKAPADVITVKTGIIESINDYSGVALYDVGDTVIAGQTVVSGEVTSGFGTTRYVHALADISLRTWYDYSAQMPAGVLQKSYTGNEIVKKSINIAGILVKLHFSTGINYSEYDKITVESRFDLFGLSLPITVITTRYVEYTTEEITLDSSFVEEELQQALLEKLNSRLADESSIVNAQFSKSGSELVRITLHAECIEQTGAVRPIETAETVDEGTTQ